MHIQSRSSSPFFDSLRSVFVEILTGENVGILSNSGTKHYVNQVMNMAISDLWKTLVEKSVEIVEKFEFSTTKSGFTESRNRASLCIKG